MKTILDLNNFIYLVDSHKVLDNLSHDEGWQHGKPILVNLERVIDNMLDREVASLVQEAGHKRTGRITFTGDNSSNLSSFYSAGTKGPIGKGPSLLEQKPMV